MTLASSREPREEAQFACPRCGERIDKTCGCGRVWDGWVYAEEVIYLGRSHPVRAPSAPKGDLPGA